MCLYVFICVLSHYDDVIGVGTFLHVMLHVHLVLLSHDTLRHVMIVYPKSLHAYLSHCSLLD